MIKKNGILSLILRTLMFVIVSISMVACPWSAEAVETRDYDVIVVGAGTEALQQQSRPDDWEQGGPI